MKRSTFLAATLLAIGIACVPATDDEIPRGAAGLTINPTPESAGKPFVTSDGWTIHVETLAMWVGIQANQAPADAFGSGAGGFTNLLFHASHPGSAFVRSLPPVDVRVQVASAYHGLDFVPSSSQELFGDLDLLPRFNRPSDDSDAPSCPELPECNDPEGCYFDGTKYPADCGPPNPPGLWIAMTATKDGRSERLDVTLDTGFGTYHPEIGSIVRVVPNAVRNGNATVDVTKLFTNEAGAVVFDEIAIADANGDGILTIPELRAVTQPIKPVLDPSDGYLNVPPGAKPDYGDAGAEGDPDADLSNLPPSVFDDDDPTNDVYRIDLVGLFQSRFDKMFSYP